MNDTTPLGRPLPRALLVLALAAATPGALPGQEVRGVVREAGTTRPLAEVVVRSPASGAIALTRSDGSFRLPRVPEGLRTLTFRKYGYAEVVRAVDVPTDEPLEVELEPLPIELEGLEVTARSFESRFAEVQTKLDTRIGKMIGDVQVAGPARIRPYDELHEEDPWTFLIREMQLDPTMSSGTVRVRGFQALAGRTQRPEVYIDDRRTWLFRVVHTPLSLFCRVEFFTPMPHDARIVKPPAQLRAYTCAYMAEVANGDRELSEHVNWGGLIAGGEE